MAEKNAKKKSKKRRRYKLPIRSTILAFLATILALYFIITGFETWLNINETKQKIKEAQATYEAINNENKYMEDLIKNANQNDIIERIARERLGYVFPDEKIYQDVN